MKKKPESSPAQPTLSVAIVAYNEAGLLADCLESVSWADEIVVIDLESTDNTVDVARHYTERVLQHPRVDFADIVRNYSFEQTSGDWILMLDPDERITPRLACAIQSAICCDSELVALKLPFVTYYFGQEIKYTGYGVDYIPRVFRRGAVTWQPMVHFRPTFTGKVDAIPYDPDRQIAVIHINYTSVGQFIEKMNRYTDSEASKILARGRSFRWDKPFTYGLREFVTRYFLLRGYRDGVRGLIISVLFAIYWSVVALKLWDMDRERQGQLKKHDS